MQKDCSIWDLRKSERDRHGRRGREDREGHFCTFLPPQVHDGDGWMLFHTWHSGDWVDKRFLLNPSFRVGSRSSLVMKARPTQIPRPKGVQCFFKNGNAHIYRNQGRQRWHVGP